MHLILEVWQYFLHNLPFLVKKPDLLYQAQQTALITPHNKYSCRSLRGLIETDLRGLVETESWQSLTPLPDNPYHKCTKCLLNILRPEQNGCQFTDEIFKCVFLKKRLVFWLRFHWSLFLMGSNDKMSALDQVMAWRQTGHKPRPEPMMTQSYIFRIGENELRSRKGQVVQLQAAKSFGK